MQDSRTEFILFFNVSGHCVESETTLPMEKKIPIITDKAVPSKSHNFKPPMVDRIEHKPTYDSKVELISKPAH